MIEPAYDMLKEIDSIRPVQNQKGITYVPVPFFVPFFNDVVVNDGNVSISAQVSTI
ncbi:hypothetical protein [Paenibacillus amylolyticus]|uniref:hypothetical protein n=1 Tax=Paenibacillus amylolyticus TaxID=1451 RepID=UPI001428C90C|nr:hypothetical protein [Paenibacillus amylolyticus]